MAAVPLLPAKADAESLALAEVMPGDVDEERHAVLAHDERAAALLDAALATRRASRQALTRTGVGMPPSQRPRSRIERPEVEHRPAARLVAPLAPAELVPARTEDVPAAAHALDPAELAALHEAAHDLHVRAVAVVHARPCTISLALLRRPDDPLRRSRPSWSSGFSTRTCRLAESAARMCDSCRWLGEQMTTASRPSVRSRSSMSSNASFTPNRSASARAFGQVGVADRLHLDRLELLEHGQVSHLGDAPRRR